MQHQALLAEHAAVVAEIQNKNNRLAAYHYYREETANLDSSDFLGRIALLRIYSGKIKKGQQVAWISWDDEGNQEAGGAHGGGFCGVGVGASLGS